MQLGAASKTSTETWLLDATDPAATLRSVAPRREDIEYDVEVAGDRLFIVHNDGAPDFALAQAPLTSTDAADWTPIWPGEPGVRLLGVVSYDRVLVQSLRRDGLQVVTLRHRDAAGDVGEEVGIAFDEPIYTVDVDGGDEADTDRIRLHYQSMVTPDAVDRLPPRRPASCTVLRRRPVLDHPVHGPYRPTDYGQHRVWADGRRTAPACRSRWCTGPTPRWTARAGCLLYGYGSYEISVDPYFSIARPRLLDRGVVFADRPRARRRRAGPALVRRGQAAGQEEHLHRLRRLRAPPGRRPAGPPPTGWRPRAAAPAAC